MASTASYRFPFPRRLYNHIAGVIFLFISVSLLVHYGSQNGIPTRMDLTPVELSGDSVIPQCTCATRVEAVITKTVTVSYQQSPTPVNEGGRNRGFHRAYDEDYKSLLTEPDIQLIQKLRTYTLPTNINTHESNPAPAIPVFNGALRARLQLFTDLYSIGSPSGPRSWMQYLDSLPPQHLPPLQHITQHYIHSHQHPTEEECKKNTKFLVLPSFRRGSGLGSILHGATHALSVAIRSGRVLIYDQRDGDGNGIGIPGKLFAGDGAECPGSKGGINCFFEPITSCSWSDVRLPDSDESNAIFFHPYSPQEYEAIKHPTLGYVTRFGDLPPVLGFLLQEWEDLASGGTGVLMSPNARKLWWRGQAAGYLARINPWAMEQLKEMRHTEKAKRVGVRGNNTELPMPFPLPHHSISIHVRHGDKASEMNLVPFSSYISAATKVANENPSRGTVSKTIFLSTEDPLVIDEMYNIAATEIMSDTKGPTTSNLEWTFFYTAGIPRRNGGPKEEVAPGEEVQTTLMHLGELMLSLESGAWVGTRASNWCRLVDELAQVWVGGAGAGGSPGVFLEVGNTPDWVDYHF